MTKHKHADLMLQYAQDAAKTDKPWELWECLRLGVKSSAGWSPVGDQPCWSLDYDYRRKPEKSDQEKYGVEVGDVWRTSEHTLKTIGVYKHGHDRDIYGYALPFRTLQELLFRRGVVNKL